MSFTVLCHEVQPTANSWECSKTEFQPILLNNFDQATFMCIYNLNYFLAELPVIYVQIVCVYFEKKRENSSNSYTNIKQI